MTCLVDGDGALLGLCHHLGLLLQTADDSIHSVEEVLLLHCLTVMACCYQRSLITYIGDIRTRESWGLTGEEIDIHTVVGLHGLQMHLKHLLALVQVWQIHMDLTIKTTCTQQGGVEHIGTVGGSKDDHT